MSSTLSGSELQKRSNALSGLECFNSNSETTRFGDIRGDEDLRLIGWYLIICMRWGHMARIYLDPCLGWGIEDGLYLPMFMIDFLFFSLFINFISSGFHLIYTSSAFSMDTKKTLGDNHCLALFISAHRSLSLSIAEISIKCIKLNVFRFRFDVQYACGICSRKNDVATRFKKVTCPRVPGFQRHLWANVRCLPL